MKLMDKLGQVDLIITDPPYGIDYQSQRKRDKAQWFPKIKGDKAPFIDFIPKIKRLLKPNGACFIFTRWDVQQLFIEEMNNNDLKVRNVLIWDKVIHGMGDLKKSYGSRYESILFHSENEFRFPNKRPQDIIRCQRVNANRLVHPNEKPVELIETLIKQCSKPGAIVFDPFMGSGTTCVAAINTGRKYIGCDIDKAYFDIAQERINKAKEVIV